MSPQTKKPTPWKNLLDEMASDIGLAPATNTFHPDVIRFLKADDCTCGNIGTHVCAQCDTFLCAKCAKGPKGTRRECGPCPSCDDKHAACTDCGKGL